MGWKSQARSLQSACKSAFSDAEDVLWFAPVTGVRLQFDGIFESSYVEIEESITSREPTIWFVLSDLGIGLNEELDDNDVFEVNGVRYSVVDFQPDGQGAAIVILRRL